MSDTQELIFIDYFLSKRLARVPADILETFVATWRDTSDLKSQKKLIKEILFQLSIMKNDQEFILNFKNFIRDCVLSARESEYLLRITDKVQVLQWLNSLRTGSFSGQKYDFTLHTFLKFEEKILEDFEKEENESEPIYFPTELFLLIGTSKNPIVVPNGLEIVYYHPTNEFEILFRGDMNLIEVRGDFQVIRDFVSTATLDRSNPLSTVESVFVGDRSETKPNSSLVRPAKFIKIEKLRTAIKGSYLSASSIVSGTKTSRVTLEFEGLSDFGEETDAILQAVVKRTIKDPDKTKISFKYRDKVYSFGITKSGGLNFMKYTPEEVVTYILKKLRDLSRS